MSSDYEKHVDKAKQLTAAAKGQTLVTAFFTSQDVVGKYGAKHPDQV